MARPLKTWSYLLTHKNVRFVFMYYKKYSNLYVYDKKTTKKSSLRVQSNPVFMLFASVLNVKGENDKLRIDMKEIK